MSNSIKKPNPFNFISFDGTDEEGVRAEVNVQKNTGKISKILTQEDKGVADVHFSVEGLKFAVHGWVSTDAEIFELAKTAKANDEEVSFRIETQRHQKIARDIPMSELRANTEIARESVKTLLVGINGILSNEAVTNPAEDPKSTNGRYVAGDEDIAPRPTGNANSAAVDSASMLANFEKALKESIRPSVLDAMSAQLILAGVDPEVVNKTAAGVTKRDTEQPPVQSAFATEAPSWKDYNSDGRANLGSATIAASVGVETLLNEQVREYAINEFGGKKVENQDDIVDYYLNITLAICDRIQNIAYGEGSRPDRGAASHVRVRGIVYELLKKETTLPLDWTENETSVKASFNKDKHNEWVRFLGTTGATRFQRAIRAAHSYPGFKYGVPASLRPDGEQVVQQEETPQQPVNRPAPVEEETPVVDEAPVQDVVPEATEPVQQEEPVQEPLVVAGVTIQPNYQNGNVEEEVVVTTDFYPMGELNDEDVEGEEKATTATLKALANLFEGSGYNLKDAAEMSRISALLSATFGAKYSNPREIPDALLEEFVDHYVNVGTETLNNAVQYALNAKVSA